MTEKAVARREGMAAGVAGWGMPMVKKGFCSKGNEARNEFPKGWRGDAREEA